MCAFRKSSLIALVGIAAFPFAASADVLCYEPFNYAPATSLPGAAGALGTTGAYVRWTNGSAASTLGDLSLASTSLAYPGGVSSSGGSVSDAASTLSDGDYIQLTTPLDLSNTGIARSYYISFLEQRFWSTATAPSSSAFFGVDFSATPSLSPRTGGSVDITFGAGSAGTFRTGGDPQNGSTGLTNTVVAGTVGGNAVATTVGSVKYTDTYFILGRIDVSSTGAVTTHIKSYPNATTAALPTTDPSTWDANATLATYALSYGYLQVRKGNNIGQNIDEILVGTTLADVSRSSGACCAANGSCSITVAGGCTGSFSTSTLSCNPNPCAQPQVGVCCQSNGSCTAATPGIPAAICSTGTLVVNGTCNPNTCPQPQVGVCCQSDGSCIMATPGIPSASCSTGTLIVGGTCNPNTCVQPQVGVCCQSDGSCTIATPGNATGTNTATCSTGSLTVNGSCSPNTCPQPQVGACCAFDGTCAVATPGIPNASCASGALVINGTCSPNTCVPGTGGCCSGVLLYEPFNYNAAPTLGGQSGALGSVGAYATWAATNAPAAADLLLDPGSLVYPPGTTLTASGNSVRDFPAATQNGDYIALSNPISLTTPGTYYLSFLVQRFWATASGRPTGQAFFGVDFNSDQSVPRPFVEVTFGCGSAGTFRTGGDNANNAALTSSVVAGTAAANAAFTTSGDYTLTDTYFVLGRIVIDSSGGVTTSIRSYPASSTSVPAAEPTTWDATATLAPGSFAPSYSNVQIRKGASIGTAIDELIVGHTFTEVTQHSNAPSGVCCRGATCSQAFATEAACLAALPATQPGAVHKFIANGAPCNSAPVPPATMGNALTPCCFANYNHNATLEVQDIFDFLNDWFAGKPIAIPSGDGDTGTLAVQNIFDFLNAWFAGGCI